MTDVLTVLNRPQKVKPMFVDLHSMQTEGKLSANASQIFVDTLFNELNNSSTTDVLSVISDKVESLKKWRRKLFESTDEINSAIRSEVDQIAIDSHKKMLSMVNDGVKGLSDVSSQIKTERQKFITNFFSANAVFKTNIENWKTGDIPDPNVLLSKLDEADSKIQTAKSMLDDITPMYNVIVEPEDLQELIVPKTDIYVKFETSPTRGIVAGLYTDPNREYSYGQNFTKDTIALFSGETYTFHIQSLDSTVPPGTQTDHVSNIGISFLGSTGSILSGTASNTTVSVAATSLHNTYNSFYGTKPVYFNGSVSFTGSDIFGFVVSDKTGALAVPGDNFSKESMVHIQV